MGEQGRRRKKVEGSLADFVKSPLQSSHLLPALDKFSMVLISLFTLYNILIRTILSSFLICRVLEQMTEEPQSWTQLSNVEQRA